MVSKAFSFSPTDLRKETILFFIYATRPGGLMQERRKSARARVLKSAKLLLGTSSVLDCVIRNVTNSGARVQIANTVPLPDTLSLTLDGGYSVRPCRVAWRSVTETGLEFLKTRADMARS